MSDTDGELLDSEEHWLADTRSLRRGNKLPRFCIVATVLGIFLLVAIMIIAGLAVGVKLEHDKANNVSPTPTTPTHSPTTTPAPGGSTTCTTPECVELSSQILSRLDDSFDPCEDFYNFTCNKYDRNAMISYGRAGVGTFSSLGDKNLERFNSLLSSVDMSTGGAIAKAAIYYQSCLKTEEVEANALNNLTQLISELGGWPLVGIERTRSDPWDINDPNGFLQEVLYGSDAFLNFEVLSDPNNASRNVLAIAQGGMTLPAPGIYDNPAVRGVIKLLITKVFKAINPDIPDANYSTAVDGILAFEGAIANFTDFYWLTHKPLHEKLNVSNFGNLSQLMPTFNWTHNLQLAGAEGNFEVNFSAPVVILAPSKFLINLDALIQSTSNEVLENYAKWHLVYKLLPALGKAFTDIHFVIQKLITAELEPPRYKICASTVEKHVTYALARIFRDKFFPPGARENITAILNELKTALKQRISENEWLDDTTRGRATDKVNNIIDLLGYPEFIASDTALNKFYDNLTISSSAGFFINYVNAVRFKTLQKLGTLDVYNNRSEWNVRALLPPPTVVNAAYYPFGNNMYIFEGILDEPFFKTYWPTYYKFGTMGFVIGHELTHGFDSNGRFFNQVGNFESWMTPTAETAFLNQTQCLINQYDKYALQAGPVNGTLTLPENIADNGGLGTAFRAYKNLLAKTGEEQQMLPGLPYTPDQLFFIGTAQPWCEIVTPAREKKLLQDVHTPSRLRADGFVSNSPEFAEAFKCRKNAKLNPEYKCKVW